MAYVPIIIAIFLLLLLIAIGISYKYCREEFGNGKIFTAPKSLTKLPPSSKGQSVQEVQKPMKPISTVDIPIMVSPGNTVSYPSFFHVNLRWPGCLPRALYQGTCGSCWGFAVATCLSARIYIESCGNSGCFAYPQLNFGSLTNVYNNLNTIYKYHKLYIDDIFNQLDINKSGGISRQEWDTKILEYWGIFNSTTTPAAERNYITQILTYVLDFQSLGSIDLTNKSVVLERSARAFNMWKTFLENETGIAIKLKVTESDRTRDEKKKGDDEIIIEDLKNKWRSSPITLSAQKIIACCDDCIDLDFAPPTSATPAPSNLLCRGSSLEDAWQNMRNFGTPDTICIGYTVDDWKEGDYTASCLEVMGPEYSFCSGYSLVHKQTNTRSLIKELEKKELNSIPHENLDLPWVDPILFTFKAKNVYKIKNDMHEIMNELLERGPITTGYTMYEDFQYTFGGEGLGGQNFKGGNPVGSSSNSLIYKWNGRGKPIGGHSITIVGYGSYLYTPSATTSPSSSPLTGSATHASTTTPSPSSSPSPSSVNTSSSTSTSSVPSTASPKISTASKYIPYWICLNSWGVEWGHSGSPEYENRNGLPKSMDGGGYFWILRGENECDIEDNCIVGQPDIDNIVAPGVSSKYGWGVVPPREGTVDFIKTSATNSNFVVNPSLSSGGTFITRNVSGKGYVDKSMNPPSPYTFFWDDVRPAYILGPIGNDLQGLYTDSTITIDNDMYSKLGKIMTVGKFPIFFIGDEQLQLVSINESNGKKYMTVFRAVNSTLLARHSTGDKIIVIPFKNASVPFLAGILPKYDIDYGTVE